MNTYAFLSVPEAFQNLLDRREGHHTPARPSWIPTPLSSPVRSPPGVVLPPPPAPVVSLRKSTARRTQPHADRHGSRTNARKNHVVRPVDTRTGTVVCRLPAPSPRDSSKRRAATAHTAHTARGDARSTCMYMHGRRTVHC
jgi:hypothetical protein